MIRPRFYFWLLFLFGVWVGTHFGHWPWVNLLLFFLLLLPLFSLLSALISKRRIKLQLIGEEPYIERGQYARWYFRLNIRHQLRTLFLHGQFFDSMSKNNGSSEEFRIRPGEQFQLVIEMAGRHCGKVRPHHFQLRMLDPLGFFSLKLGKITEDQFADIAVMPLSLMTIREQNDTRSPIEAGEHASKKSDTDLDEIDRMRPMQAGDRMRSIHWKLSARMQTWMVRQYEKADEAQLCFLVNLPHVEHPEDPEEEPLLTLRDRVLDQVSASCQSLLNDGYKILLKTRMPWPVVTTADSMSEYDMLRIQLAGLPFEQTVSIEEQLFEEEMLPGSRFYCIVSADLNENLATELLILASRAQGILLQLVSPSEQIPAQWQEQIKRLSQLNIKVQLIRLSGRRV